ESQITALVGELRLFENVRKKPKEAGPLDSPRQLALLLRRHRCDAARHDLAALRDIAAEQAHVLVIDLRRILTRERAGLATAMERPPCGGLRNVSHDLALRA